MADSSLIPDILDNIVHNEIIPLLPWHTRPVLMALTKKWRNVLHAIGGQVENLLNYFHGEVPMARTTRLKQPLKCRLAVEYYHTYRDRQNQFKTPGYLLKLFDGQWRNVAPISGTGPYTYTNSDDGAVLGVVDGTLYFVHSTSVHSFSIKIIDVGGGLWQWKKVFAGDHDCMIFYWHICRSDRAAGRNLFVYRRCGEGDALYSHCSFEIRDIPAWERIGGRAPDLRNEPVSKSPLPILVHVGNRLYFFGAVDYTENVCFLDLTSRAWNGSRVVSEFRGSLNVQKDVLLVAQNGIYFHILRYDSSKKRWIRAARMLPPPNEQYSFKWTWCVEYDEQSEKQLWIYIFTQYMGEALDLYKLRVPLTCRAWDDTMLADGEVECELVDCTPVDQSFQPIEPVNDENVPTLYVPRFFGFHRSDSTNFEDIPHESVQ